MEKVVFLSARAVGHLEKAFLWYQQISPAIATKFEEDILQTLTKLQTHPGAFRKFKKNTRRIILPRFPYMIVYVMKEEVIHVIAIFHLTRSNKNKHI